MMCGGGNTCLSRAHTLVAESECVCATAGITVQSLLFLHYHYTYDEPAKRERVDIRTVKEIRGPYTYVELREEQKTGK